MDGQGVAHNSRLLCGHHPLPPLLLPSPLLLPMLPMLQSAVASLSDFLADPDTQGELSEFVEHALCAGLPADIADYCQQVRGFRGAGEGADEAVQGQGKFCHKQGSRLEVDNWKALSASPQPPLLPLHPHRSLALQEVPVLVAAAIDGLSLARDAQDVCAMLGICSSEDAVVAAGSASPSAAVLAALLGLKEPSLVGGVWWVEGVGGSAADAAAALDDCRNPPAAHSSSRLRPLFPPRHPHSCRAALGDAF